MLAANLSWTIIPSGIGGLVLLLRTVLENRTLREELEGYSEYARHVRYCLSPGLW